MSDNPAFVILSAFRATDPYLLNAKRTARLRAALKTMGCSFKDTCGSYKGAEEDGFLVVLTPSFGLADAIELAAWYAQESVLHVTEDRTARLVFTADEAGPVDLGFFKRIDPWTASRLDAWTYCDGAYYAARQWP